MAYPPDGTEFGKLDAAVGKSDELQQIDARLDEVRRFGAVLQRKGQLNRAKATHYWTASKPWRSNERERVMKAAKLRALCSS